MATFYIEEFVELMVVNREGLAVGRQPSIARQTKAIGAEAKSNPFNPKTKFVRLHTDAICSYLFGDNPTAAVTDSRLAANATEYFGVEPGGNMKVSVISNT